MSWGACLGAGNRIDALADQAARWERVGIDHLWVGEVRGADAATATSAVAAATEVARIGMVWNVFLRSVALSAMTIGTLADAAPGRLDVAFGVSSPLLVEGWHGARFERPVAAAWSRCCRGCGPRWPASGWPAASSSTWSPPCFPGSSWPRPGRACSREAGPLVDAVVVNWCTADDLARVPGLPDDPSALSGLVYVCPTDDVHEARAAARRLMGGYLSAPGYAALQRLVGRGPAFAEYSALAAAGEFRAAAAAIPDDVIDELVVHGSPMVCRARLADWEARGLTPLVVRVGPVEYESRIDRLAIEPQQEVW